MSRARFASGSSPIPLLGWDGDGGDGVGMGWDGIWDLGWDGVGRGESKMLLG